MLGILRGLRGARQAQRREELMALLPSGTSQAAVLTQEEIWRNTITTSGAFKTYFKREDVSIADMHDCLRSLSLSLQREILEGLLDNFGRGLIGKIIALQDSELELNMLLALMARHELMAKMREGINGNPVVRMQDYFSDIPLMSTFKDNEQLKQRIKDIIFEQVNIPAGDYLDGPDAQYDPSCLVKYLEELPFPLNIKCLSEALNANTNWSRFLDRTLDTAGIINCRVLVCVRICNALARCSANVQGSWNPAICPEIRAIAQPDLIGYAPQIRRLLIETKSPERTLSDASRAWAQESGAKRAVLEFIETIPDETRKNSIRARELMIAFLNIIVLSRYDRVGAVARGLNHLMWTSDDHDRQHENGHELLLCAVNYNSR